MKEHKSTSVPSDRVLAYIRQHNGLHRGHPFDSVPYYLMSMILKHHDFDDIESLIAFCEDRNNLRRWLPSEADRIVFSSELVRGLREMSAEPRMKSDMPAATRPPSSPASCSA